MLPIKACLKVKNVQGFYREVGDKDGVLIDLQESVSADGFKEHLLLQAKLSMTQKNRYLLWIYLAKSNKDLKESNYSQIPNAICTDLDLREVVMAALHLDGYMVITLEKFTTGMPRSRFAGAAKQAKDLEFDLEGLVKDERKHLLNYERPNVKIYPCKAPDGGQMDSVPCAFCQQPSSSEQLREKVGPIYGPIKCGKKYVFTHELCAIWTPEIFLDSRNMFRNMKDAVWRCRNLKCSYCKEAGAGLGCFNEICKNTYHYLCAKAAGCLLVQQKFIAYCPEHRHDAPKEMLELEMEEEDEVLQGYYCSVCSSGLDENMIVICDNCDRGFHTSSIF